MGISPFIRIAYFSMSVRQIVERNNSFLLAQAEIVPFLQNTENCFLACNTLQEHQRIRTNATVSKEF